MTKVDGTRAACSVGDGTGAATDVVYLAPTATEPARLRFGGACLLQQGDAIDVKVVCAG